MDARVLRWYHPHIVVREVNAAMYQAAPSTEAAEAPPRAENRYRPRLPLPTSTALHKLSRSRTIRSAWKGQATASGSSSFTPSSRPPRRTKRCDPRKTRSQVLPMLPVCSAAYLPVCTIIGLSPNPTHVGEHRRSYVASHDYLETSHQAQQRSAHVLLRVLLALGT